MIIQPLFETERLLVRHFGPDDLDDFAALCADSEVMRYVGDGETLPRGEVARWIEICQTKYETRGYGTSAVLERASGTSPDTYPGTFVGYCGVVRAPGNDFDELIYVFHKRAWGRGYAAEVGRAMPEYVSLRFHARCVIGPLKVKVWRILGGGYRSYRKRFGPHFNLNHCHSQPQNPPLGHNSCNEV